LAFHTDYSCCKVHDPKERGMNKKILIKKIFLFGLLPFIIISIAMAIFGREPVHKFMLYTTPVMLLPLLIKIIIKRKEKKRLDRAS
jgi:hypothetical protein